MIRIQKLKGRLLKKIRQIPLFYPHKSNDAVKWAIIGLGNMAEVFATALDSCKNSKIMAVASRSITKAKAFSSRHGHPLTYGSYESLLADDNLELDVVYIATPAKYHAKHIHQCLMAGKNVVCEKPITIDSAELESLIAIAKEKNLFLMEGMWMVFLPPFQKAKEWLDNDVIGSLELIRVDFYKREFVRPELSVFNASEGGGVLCDYGVYAISFALYFLGGYPDEIVYERRLSSLGIDSDWQICLKRGITKAFINISSDFKSSSKAVLIGSKGAIEWDSQFNRSNRVSLFNQLGQISDSFKIRYKCEGYEYEIKEVNHCIRYRKLQSSNNPLSHSLDTISVINTLLTK